MSGADNVAIRCKNERKKKKKLGHRQCDHWITQSIFPQFENGKECHGFMLSV